MQWQIVRRTAHENSHGTGFQLLMILSICSSLSNNFVEYCCASTVTDDTIRTMMKNSLIIIACLYY